MKKFLRPPENWQDFEQLCKKLFGEIWKCPNIKANGRLGQDQSGVDIYGKPVGENEYWGIQCKGKDNFLEKQLSVKEIDAEIEKAKGFRPQLKTFIFATTAPKDVLIEQYIREKDLQNVAAASFEIFLFSWNDLSDLIEENRNTFNWYVNNIQFKDQFDANVSISSENGETELHPKFIKKIQRYEFVDLSSDILRKANTIKVPWLSREYVPLFGSGEINHAWCKTVIHVENTGSIVLEDWKLEVEFLEGVTNYEDDSPHWLYAKELMKYRTSWKLDNHSMLFKPLENQPLVQKDSKGFRFAIKPNKEECPVKMKWRLLARNFDKEGFLELLVRNEIVDESLNRIAVNNLGLVRDEVELLDYKEKKPDQGMQFRK